jgi:signal transduction histidine kinase
MAMGAGRLSSPRERTLTLIFVTVLVSFVVATAIGEHASSEIDALSDGIVSNASPSIGALARLRGAVVQTELTLGHLMRDDEPVTEIEAALARRQAEIDQQLTIYVELPQFRGESHHWRAVQDACARFDEAVKRTLALAATDRPAAAALYLSTVEPAGDRVLAAAVNAIEFNAQNERELAAQIKAVRWRAIWISNLLVALCVGLGLTGGAVIRHLARSRRAVLEARAAELSEFAGRVAHDIRSPLAGARLAAELLERKSAAPETVERAGRVVRSLARADAIIGGLLEFARAGARPEPGSRTGVRAVIADMTPALSAEAEHGHIELAIAAVPPVLAACSTGVYLSLIGNLVRNAMKFMGDAKVRRVAIRVSVEQHLIRTEVSDTGPGISPHVLSRLFEPWFRGQAEGGPSGFGLGLSTVKRLAEGHCGSVGVRSSPGEGSTFWFLLPMAGVAPVEDEAPAPRASGAAG